MSADPIKIPLKLVDLQNQKFKKQYEAWLHLYPNRLHYKVEFKSEEPIDNEDKSVGWEPVMTYWEQVSEINSVVGVDLEYVQATKRNNNEENRWVVVLFLFGHTNDLKMWFDDENAARECFKQCHDWKFLQP